MKCFIAVDERNGIAFNKRRQSKDRKLIEYILEITQGYRLLMNSYSFKQFECNDTTNIIVDDDFLAKATDEFCFIENQPLIPHLENITSIYLCYWNRDYPSDMKFDIDLYAGWKLKSAVDIVGNSHKKITIKEWEKL